MENKYRIKEFDGKFTIQVEMTEEKKCFFHKRKIVKYWARADRSGNARVYIPFVGFASDPCDTFDSLYAAKKQIQSWEDGVIYHDV